MVPQFLIHSPSGEPLGHFQLLVITDKAVMNTALYVSVWTSAFLSLRYRPGDRKGHVAKDLPLKAGNSNS